MDSKVYLQCNLDMKIIKVYKCVNIHTDNVCVPSGLGIWRLFTNSL